MDVVPVDVIDLKTMTAQLKGSVLDVLFSKASLATSYSDCEVSAVSLNREVADKLEVAEGQPSFLIDELTRSEDGLILDWSTAWTLNKHFKFTLRRQG